LSCPPAGGFFFVKKKESKIDFGNKSLEIQYVTPVFTEKPKEAAFKGDKQLQNAAFLFYCNTI
jgi:hypothetical protein